MFKRLGDTGSTLTLKVDGKAIRARNDKVSAGVRAIAWKAQQRLHKRLSRLTERGKPATQAVTAVARELVGFIWAIAREEVLLAG